MKKILLSISSPNNRGMHIYTKNLGNLLEISYQTEIKFPIIDKKDNKLKTFIKQIIWELYSISEDKLRNYKSLINVHPRFSLDLILKKKTNNCKKGVVIHDYIQCIKIKDLFKDIKIYLKPEIYKKIYHTLIFRKTIKASDFFIYNSYYTLSEINKWVHKENTQNKPLLVMHPLPSFKPLEVKKNSIYLKGEENEVNETIKILFVTGSAISKRSNMIIPIMKIVSNLNISKQFRVSIIGPFKHSKEEIPSNLKLEIPNKSIPKEKLIEKYLISHIYVSTSRQEGFGIPLLDATIFDMWSVVSNIGSYKEISETYGTEKINLIKDHENIESYAKEISKIIKKCNKTINYSDKIDIYTDKYNKLFKVQQRRIESFMSRL